MKNLILLTALFLLTAAGTVYAQQTPAVPAAEDEIVLAPEQENRINPAGTDNRLFSVWDFIRMLLVLAFVLGIIYVFYFFLKKLSKPVYEESGLIKVVAAAAVAAGKTIHIVEAAGTYYILASGESSVTLIDKIEDKEKIDMIRVHASSSASENSSGGFKKLLQKMLNPGASDRMERKLTMHDTLAFIKQQKDRLKKL